MGRRLSILGRFGLVQSCGAALGLLRLSVTLPRKNSLTIDLLFYIMKWKLQLSERQLMVVSDK